MNKKLKRILRIVAVIFLLPIILYVVGKGTLYGYADYWAAKLIKLDEKGLLSTKFGAAWQEVVYGESYQDLINGSTFAPSRVVEGVEVNQYPSISVVEKLNRINRYSSKILIEDRKGREIAAIRTDHSRVSFKSFPKTLVQSVVITEDQNFFTNRHGFEFDSFLRAVFVSVIETIRTGKKASPRGTSTITQQVAKMFISQIDTEGNRHVSHTVDRKLRELRIAAALRKRHTSEEIMEIYLNHCLTSSYGLIGAEEISRGLWGKSVVSLNDAESVYLSRMVKWGANIPDRIKLQCHIDMGRIGSQLKWTQNHQKKVLKEIDGLTFLKPTPIVTGQPHLIDLANICWLQFLEKQGFSETRQRQLNLLDPSALIRKKGDVTIRLTIDLPLQQFMTKAIDERGYADSLMVTDIRIGSHADTLKGSLPEGTSDLWKMRVLTKRELFSDPGSSYVTSLKAGDTLYTNTVYETSGMIEGTYRAVSRFYHRGEIIREQQYAYGAIDAESGKLRAFVSRDRLGSHCSGLFDRPLANGTSTIQPILGALFYDLGLFSPSGKWDDRMPVSDSIPWQRSLSITRDSGEAVVFPDGKRVLNSDSLFHGDRFIWEHLRDKNQILTTEMVLRLNHSVYAADGSVLDDGKQLADLFRRIGIEESMKSRFAGKSISGVQIIRELVRMVGGSADTLRNGIKPVPIDDGRYSSVTSDMELTLLEQMHLFNILYRGELIENPRNTLSLFLESITLQGTTFNIGTMYPSESYELFADRKSLRPVQLGLFETFNNTSSTSYSQLSACPDSVNLWARLFNPTNFCSIGSSDPHVPYSYDRLAPSNSIRWGIQNSIVSINASRISGDSIPDPMNLTIGAVGEWRKGMVPSAGKNGVEQHRFLSTRLVQQYGQKSIQKKDSLNQSAIAQDLCFFDRYRQYIDSLWIKDSLAMFTPVESTLLFP